MKNFISDLLIKLKLRFRNPDTEQDYYKHIRPFTSVNLLFFLLFLLAIQTGMLAYEVISNQIHFAIPLGVCLLINIFILVFRKKFSSLFERATILFVSVIYVICTLHIENPPLSVPTEFTREHAFFQGYWLCLFHQIALKCLTNFAEIFLLDIAGVIFRSVLFRSSANAFPYSYAMQIFIDLIMFYTIYRKEVNNRLIYSHSLTQKEGTAKFKSLMVNSLPENIIILDTNLTGELLVNKAFKTVFRGKEESKSETSSDFQGDLRRTFIMKESLEGGISLTNLVEKFLSENPIVTLWDFLQQGLRSKLFKEEVFIVYGTLTPPTTHKSGMKRRIFEIKIFCLRWDNEEAVVVIFNEVTHRETILTLKLSDMSKDKVISSVSHELRTPLNGIQGMIQIMQKQTDDMHMQQSLAICKSSADLLLHIINSIIDLQFLTKNKLVLHKSRVNITELINQIGSLFIFQCEHKRLDLTLSIDEGGPEHIVTDKERLTQVLVHLASNAVKFTFKGGITIGARKDPNNPESIVFSVSDTGTGIKENNKSALFKMYGHADTNSVGTQGIGLGLTISKELVMRLKATKKENVFDVDTEFGKGSTFSFSLPLDLNKAELQRSDEEDFGEVGQEYDHSDHRALVIRSRRYSNKRFEEKEEEKAEDEGRGTFLSQMLMKRGGARHEEDLEDVGEELYMDRNLSDLLYIAGPSLIQDKITHYVTRPKYNTYKLIDGSSSGKITLDESPTLKSLFKITSPGLPLDFQSKSQTCFVKDERRVYKDSLTPEEKIEIMSDFSSVPLKMNDSNRKRIAETYTHNLDNSHLLARDIQSATSIISTPRDKTERKRSKITSRQLARTLTKQYQPKSVLLVDDNSFNLVITKHIIEESGFQVTTALTGSEAIIEVKKSCQEGNTPFKLILMDLQMPIMDGFETTAILIKMMKNNEIPEIPIVALTANTTEEDVAKCLQYGMVSHLAKPLKTEELERVFIRLENS